MDFFVIKAYIRNLTPFVPPPFKCFPDGKQIRGAIGYIAKDLQLKCCEHFLDPHFKGFIFRNCLPVCGRCKEVVEDTFCPVCGKRVLPGAVKTQMILVKRPFFRASIADRFYSLPAGQWFLMRIITAENYLDEIYTCLKVAQELGLYLGKHRFRGYGQFEIKEIDIKKAMPEAITFKKQLTLTLKSDLAIEKVFFDPQTLNRALEALQCHLQKDWGIERLKIKLVSTRASKPGKVKFLIYEEELQKAHWIKTNILQRGSAFVLALEGIEPALMQEALGWLVSIDGVGKYIGLGFGEVKFE